MTWTESYFVELMLIIVSFNSEYSNGFTSLMQVAGRFLSAVPLN